LKRSRMWRVFRRSCGEPAEHHDLSTHTTQSQPREAIHLIAVLYAPGGVGMDWPDKLLSTARVLRRALPPSQKAQRCQRYAPPVEAASENVATALSACHALIASLQASPAGASPLRQRQSLWHRLPSAARGRAQPSRQSRCVTKGIAMKPDWRRSTGPSRPSAVKLGCERRGS
jgi:hypothetical protein